MASDGRVASGLSLVGAWVVGIVIAVVSGPILGFVGAQIEYLVAPLVGWGGYFGADPFWGYIGGWMIALFLGFEAGGWTREAIASRLNRPKQP